MSRLFVREEQQAGERVGRKNTLLSASRFEAENCGGTCKTIVRSDCCDGRLRLAATLPLSCDRYSLVARKVRAVATRRLPVCDARQSNRRSIATYWPPYNCRTRHDRSKRQAGPIMFFFGESVISSSYVAE